MIPGLFWDLCLLLFAEASADFKIEHEKKGFHYFMLITIILILFNIKYSFFLLRVISLVEIEL